MFAVVMIVLNGRPLTLLGRLRYHEQTCNLQGANALLAGAVQATFFIGWCCTILLAMQNVRHREYFVDPDRASAGNSNSR